MIDNQMPTTIVPVELPDDTIKVLDRLIESSDNHLRAFVIRGIVNVALAGVIDHDVDADVTVEMIREYFAGVRQRDPSTLPPPRPS